MAWKKPRKFVPLHKRKAHNARLRKKGVKPASFANKVMKIVRKAEQTKSVVTGGILQLGNYASLTPNLAQTYAGVNPTTLPVAQGTGAGDRIGDKIRIKKVLLKAVLFPNVQAATVNFPQLLQETRIMVGRNKLSPQLGIPIPNLFKVGDTDTAPVGNLTDLLLPYNPDAMHVYKQKTFKVGQSQWATPNINAMISDNDFKCNCKFVWDITKASPKIIDFTLSTAASQTSPIPYVMGFTVSADGSNDAYKSQAVSMQYVIEVFFTDF